MSETPTPYGSSITQRVETVEQQILQVTAVQAQNTQTISALIHAVDQLRSGVDAHFVAVEARLAGMENQLAALNRSNQLLAELLTSRLPPPKE